MSIAGDMVGEVIALLQPINDSYPVSIREYGGELDDHNKDSYFLPSDLFDGPSTSILVEYRGVEHEPEDGTNIDYLNTYSIHVWLIAGYQYETDPKKGGDPLQQDAGYAIYDMILDSMAGRKLLKDSETLALVRGERVYHGIIDGTGWSGTVANVWRLEFTVKARSKWDAVGIRAEGEPWYRAVGPVVEEGTGFQVELDVPISPVVVDFSQRAVQHLPIDRTSWRSAFPGIPIPSGMFPCTDPLSDPDVIDDVVDGVVLTAETPGSEALHRRLASGLYTQDHLGLVKFNPKRAMEFREGDSRYASADPEALDPGDEGMLAGFMVLRLRPTVGARRELLGKWVDGTTPTGWALVLEDSPPGNISLIAGDGDSSPSTLTVAQRHDRDEWIGVVFRVGFGTTSSKFADLVTPYGHESASGFTMGSLRTDGEGTAPTAYMTLGPAAGQVAFAAVWTGLAAQRAFGQDVDILEVYRKLWRGTAHPLDVKAEPGLVLERGTDQLVGLRVGSTGLTGGDEVFKLAPSADNAAEDPFELRDSVRVLPHDKDRTNLLSESEDFSSWTGGPSAPDATGPDGFESAYTVGSGSSISAASSDTGELVLSVWARSDDGGSITLELGGQVSDPVDLGGSWQRVWFKDDVATTGNVVIGAVDGDIQIWGAQLEAAPGRDVPSRYIPAAGGSADLTFTQCHVDWTVLPGPSATSGKVQAVLLAGPDMLVATGAYPALDVGHDGSNHLKVFGQTDGAGSLTWRVTGDLGTQSVDITAAEPVQLDEDIPLTVAVRWYADAVELWVDDEMAARATPSSGSFVFPTQPEKLSLMRDLAGTDKWIGAMKEVRWWK